MKNINLKDQELYSLVKKIPNEDKFFHLIKRLIKIEQNVEQLLKQKEK